VSTAAAGEITGLAQSIHYAQHLAEQAESHGPEGNEGYLAHLRGAGVTGHGLVSAREMQDAFAAAAAAAAAHAVELDKQTRVQEQYDANPDAGDKTYLATTEQEKPMTREPAARPAAEPARPSEAGAKGHYNPDQPRATDGKWTAGDAAEPASVPDALWAADDDTCFGSDKIEGRGTATELRLMDYRGQNNDGGSDSPPFVAIAPAREPGDTYAEPNLSADEAHQVAEHLDALAAQAESGHTPPKRSKYGRAGQRVRQMLATDGDLKPGDRVPIGNDDDTLPITYRDLLAMLDQADPSAGASPRRTVQAKTSSDTGGEDGLVVMDLAEGQHGTEVVVLAMEGTTSDPDDPFWDKYRTWYTPDQTRQLAGKIRSFAQAARARAARPYADLRDDDE
jgi:hypothetical protein